MPKCEIGLPGHHTFNLTLGHLAIFCASELATVEDIDCKNKHEKTRCILVYFGISSWYTQGMHSINDPGRHGIQDFTGFQTLAGF